MDIEMDRSIFMIKLDKTGAEVMGRIKIVIGEHPEGHVAYSTGILREELLKIHEEI